MHKDLNKDPGNDFRNEVRSYFGTGTQLQEMYITPSLLTAQNWDDLAEAAKWSRDERRCAEGHALGGRRSGVARGVRMGVVDAKEGASWCCAIRAITSRRSGCGCRMCSNCRRRPKVYSARSPWKDDARRRSDHPAIVLRAQEAHEFHLAAFQVLTLDILPAQTARH